GAKTPFTNPLIDKVRDIFSFGMFTEDDTCRFNSTTTIARISKRKINVFQSFSKIVDSFLALFGEWCVTPTLDTFNRIEHRFSVSDDVKSGFSHIYSLQSIC